MWHYGSGCSSLCFVLHHDGEIDCSFLSFQFSKWILDIRTRLVVTVEPKTQWMPNSDSASKLMPKCKILGQYDLPNYFYSCLKIAVSEILHIK